jgi:toxin ParE1/3/4
MYNYILAREAKEDLWRIYEYGFYKFGETQAEKYLAMFHECFNKIASSPFMFPIVLNYKNAERYCVCGVDTIYYNINKQEVEIVTIIGRHDY